MLSKLFSETVKVDIFIYLDIELIELHNDEKNYLNQIST